MVTHKPSRRRLIPADLLSRRSSSLQAGRPYNLFVSSLLDSVQWVVSAQESDWSETRSNCAEVLRSMANSAVVTVFALFFLFHVNFFKENFSDITYASAVRV